jgi:predicted nucleic-acid-binding protein
MDHKDLSAKAVTIIENENIYIKNEVLAEVVYVLNKTYKVQNVKLNSILRVFIKN